LKKTAGSKYGVENCTSGYECTIKKMTIKKYLDGHKTYDVGTLFEAKFEDKDYLFPIPQEEIEKDAALGQNPGYFSGK